MGRLEAAGQKFLDAFNRHDVDAAADEYSSDCTVEDPMYPEPLKGRDAVREDLAGYVRAFPDVRIELGEWLEKGDIGMAQYRITGTNTGPLTTPMGEVPPTGKRVEVRGAVHVRLDAEDHAVEEHRYYDTGTLMRELGLTPEPATAGSR